LIAHTVFKSHAVADRFSWLFIFQIRHPHRHRSCRQSSGLEHDDLFPGQPGFIHYFQRKDRRFSGAWRCLQDDHLLSKKFFLQFWNDLLNGVAPWINHTWLKKIKTELNEVIVSRFEA
jgi:hypothetical protein